MNYYEHHLGDYMRDTAHLSMLEDGAYRRLLDAYYIREAPLPLSTREVFRLARAQSKQEREATETVLREFFTEGPDGWRHGRCDREITRFQDKQRKAKASAEARWSKPPQQSEGNANACADAMRAHSEGNAPRARPQTPDTRHQYSDASHPALNTPSPDGEGCTRPPDEVPRAAAPQLSLVEPTPPASAPYRPPECPHLDVLALWAEVLPTMPQHEPQHWRGARADHLRARWRETAEAKRWADKAEGLAYLRRLFGYCRQSAFLMGKTEPARGRRPFAFELEWLVSPGNWARVHEGKYHAEEAA